MEIYLAIMCLEKGEVEKATKLFDVYYLDRKIENKLTVSDPNKFSLKLNVKEKKRIECFPKDNTENKIIIDPLELSEDEYWKSLNPSIIQYGSGHLICNRLVNYVHIKGNYYSLHEDGVIRTKNLFFYYNNDEVSSQIILKTDKPKRYSNILGLEDIRLFKWNGRVCFLCSTMDNHHKTYMNISYGEIENNSVNKLVHLDLGNERCEKNWLPLVYQNKLLIIYSFDPYLIYEYKDNKLELFLKNESKFDLKNLRGSCPPIEFGNGYLCVGHVVHYLKDTRSYLHRFVYLDEELKISKVSHQFYFENNDRIEYAIGLTKEKDTNEIIIGVGLNDCVSMLYYVESDVINKMLF